MTPLQGTDVGDPVLKGSTVVAGTGYDLVAGGVDIWESADQFHFAHTEREGDFDLSARVESLGAVHLYTKAGLMARSSLEAGSAHVYHLVFPGNGARNNNNGVYEAQVRSEKNGPSRAFYPPNKGVGAIEFPVAYPDVWLRLTRRANRWTAWAGRDGRVWTVYAEFDLVLPPCLQVGFAVTSHDGSKTTTALFRDVILG